MSDCFGSFIYINIVGRPLTKSPPHVLIPPNLGILCVPAQVGGFSHLRTLDVPKSSTHVLSLKLGALREVARDNIYLQKGPVHLQSNISSYLILYDHDCFMLSCSWVTLKIMKPANHITSGTFILFWCVLHWTSHAQASKWEHKEFILWTHSLCCNTYEHNVWYLVVQGYFVTLLLHYFQHDPYGNWLYTIPAVCPIHYMVLWCWCLLCSNI